MMRGIQISPKKPSRRHSKKEPRSKTYSPEKTTVVKLKKQIYNEIDNGGPSLNPGSNK